MSGAGSESEGGSENGEPSAPAAVDAALTSLFTWYPVAKKEFKDTVRSRGLWLLTAVFTALFVVPAVAVERDLIQVRRGPTGQEQLAIETGMQEIISTIYLDLVTVLLPLIAIYVGFAAISKERTSGTLKVLLSLPFSRRDVIIGKVLGRCVVVGSALSLAFFLTAFFFVASRYAFKPVPYAFFALLTLGFILVMVAIAVSISGAVRTTRRSLIGNFFVYVYVTFVWNSLANGLGRVLADPLGVGESVRWHSVLFVKLANPSQSYKTLTNSLLGRFSDTDPLRGPEFGARFDMFGRGADQAAICSDVLGGGMENQTFDATNQTVQVCSDAGNAVPFYFSDPAVAVYLLAWIGLAATLSYYTFDRVDL